jgi:serine/threonine-protein kinase RsbW
VGQNLKEQLVVSNDTRHLSSVREFISTLTRNSSLGAEDSNRVILAVDEAVSNIIEHGYEEHVEGTIEIEVESDDSKFQILIRDSGKSFNPTSLDMPDVIDHIRQGKKKGLGIFLMRQVMDEVRYLFQEGVRNELVLVKYINR